MSCGVDDSLKPGVARNQRNVFETSTLPERAASWLESFDRFLRTADLLGYRSLEPHVIDQLLPSTRPPLLASIAQHSDECLGQERLRRLGEEKAAGNRQLALIREATGAKEVVGIRRAYGDRIALEKGPVKGRRARLITRLTLVEEQLPALREIELAVLVANPEKDLIFLVRVHRVTRLHFNHEQLIRLTRPSGSIRSYAGAYPARADARAAASSSPAASPRK